MKILIRVSDSREWKAIEPVKGPEIDLQKLFVKSPELLPVEDLGVSFVVGIPELSIGAGAADILAISASGDIAIIECKRGDNPEVKREVIGQILEYAAYLWKMGYDELDSRVRNTNWGSFVKDEYLKEIEGSSLVELVRRKAKEDFEEETFRSRVRDSLEKGRFTLVIVVDEINEELKRTIQYFNECVSSEYSLYAFEVLRFVHDNMEILIPHLHPESLPPPSGSVFPITKEEFLKKCDAPGRRLFKLLEELANEKGHELKPKTQAFSYYAFSKGSKFCLLTLWPASITILKYNIHEGDKISPEAALKFQENMVRIRNLKDKYDAQKEPGMSTREGELSEDEIELFVSAFRELLDSIP